MGRFNPASCQHLTHGQCAGSEQTSHSSFSSPRNNQGTSQSDQRVSIAAATLNSHLRYVHAPSVLEPVWWRCKTQVQRKRQERKSWRRGSAGQNTLGEKGFRIGRSPLLRDGTLWHEPSEDPAAGEVRSRGILCGGCWGAGKVGSDGKVASGRAGGLGWKVQLSSPSGTPIQGQRHLSLQSPSSFLPVWNTELPHLGKELFSLSGLRI